MSSQRKSTEALRTQPVWVQHQQDPRWPRAQPQPGSSWPARPLKMGEMSEAQRRALLESAAVLAGKNPALPDVQNKIEAELKRLSSFDKNLWIGEIPSFGYVAMRRGGSNAD